MKNKKSFAFLGRDGLNTTTFTFLHLADAFIHSGYTFFVSMCVPWELNPQRFTLLTQCSTTEPQEH